jgi:hypothetical protein
MTNEVTTKGDTYFEASVIQKTSQLGEFPEVLRDKAVLLAGSRRM